MLGTGGRVVGAHQLVLQPRVLADRRPHQEDFDMSDPQLDRAFAELRKGSQASLFLMLVGVLFLLGSVYYAATRLRPLEQQVAQKKADVERLAAEEAAAKPRIAALQHDYATLKASTEQLYAVRVTPGNQVYALQPTAPATSPSAGDRPQDRSALHERKTGVLGNGGEEVVGRG